MKKSKKTDDGKMQNEKRIRFVTVLGVEYTVGAPHLDDAEVVDGKAVLTGDDIGRALLSEQCLVLTTMLRGAFGEFKKKYPLSQVSGMLYPMHGVDSVEPIDLSGDK